MRPYLVTQMLDQERRLRRLRRASRWCFLAAMLGVLWSLSWATGAAFEGEPVLLTVFAMLAVVNARSALRTLDNLAENRQLAERAVETRLFYEAFHDPGAAS